MIHSGSTTIGASATPLVAAAAVPTKASVIMLVAPSHAIAVGDSTVTVGGAGIQIPANTPFTLPFYGTAQSGGYDLQHVYVAGTTNDVVGWSYNS